MSYESHRTENKPFDLATRPFRVFSDITTFCGNIWTFPDFTLFSQWPKNSPSNCLCEQGSGVKSSEGSWPSPSQQTLKTETPQLRPKWRRSAEWLSSSTRGSSRNYDRKLVQNMNRLWFHVLMNRKNRSHYH